MTEKRPSIEGIGTLIASGNMNRQNRAIRIQLNSFNGREDRRIDATQFMGHFFQGMRGDLLPDDLAIIPHAK